MNVVSDRVLAPLCDEEHTYEELLEAIGQACVELEGEGYVAVHASEHCTEDECACGRPVLVGPAGAVA